MTSNLLDEHRAAGDDPVRLWRLEELERAGYSLSEAIMLSGRADIDLRLAVSLLEHGCAVGTALRILL